MNRLQYLVRRLLLMVPTFLGITVVCYVICQLVPGGQVDQIMRSEFGAGGGEVGGGAKATGAGGSADKIRGERRTYLRRLFHLEDEHGKPIPLWRRYKIWLVDEHMGLDVPKEFKANETVWQAIRKRFPISLTFGLTGFFLTYLVCIPLGIKKALSHGRPFDLLSSVVVFVGYAIPGFALGMILKMLFCGTNDRFWDVFPLSGFVSMNFADLGFFEKVLDIGAHMALPIVCYMVSSFAFLTILQKNSLLDQIAADYVRTAFAKGCSRRRAIWGHAFRNSLVPIATGFGGILTVMFAGSILIERVFSIEGMGWLSFDAITRRNYAVFMGIIAIQSVLALLGNIISDICYTIIDPRINFDR